MYENERQEFLQPHKSFVQLVVYVLFKLFLLSTFNAERQDKNNPIIPVSPVFHNFLGSQAGLIRESCCDTNKEQGIEIDVLYIKEK